ncbi:hypothetical protein A4G20_03075 [Pasteurellaceae bacterium RH1A]|nr:hypothetical protein A4G20_03075 [Pasteurellaceae bacterium RH1A]
MPLLIFLVGLFFYVYCEISLLVAIGSSIGVLPLILLMIAISVAGLWLIKLRGLFTIMQIRADISRGKVPTDALISSLLFVVAGILLLIPGIISDILAVLMVLPITRTFIKAYLLKYFSSKMTFARFGNFQQQAGQNPNTFDAEFERKQDEDRWIK